MPEEPKTRSAGRTLGERAAVYGGKSPAKARTGKKFWREKLAANVARDRRVNRALRLAGWRVVRVWEHELKGGDASFERLLQRIRKALGR